MRCVTNQADLTVIASSRAICCDDTPFFAAGHQVDRVEPVPQRDLAVLEDRANANGELLAALAAFVHAGTDRAISSPALPSACKPRYTYSEDKRDRWASIASTKARA